jgi:hypothetical protein
MKLTHLIVSVAFLFTTQNLTAQATPVRKVIAGNQLSWDDFSGKVDNSSKFSAMTYWYVTTKYRAQIKGDTAIIQVEAQPWFEETSWVRPDTKVPELLEHEQGHYNFSVLLAAEYKRVVDTTTFFLSDYKEKLHTIFNMLLHKYKQLEVQYDQETSHSMRQKEQARWNKWFKEVLAGTTVGATKGDTLIHQ